MFLWLKLDGVRFEAEIQLAQIMHRFSSLRSDEGGVTKCCRRRDDKAGNSQTSESVSIRVR